MRNQRHMVFLLVGFLSLAGVYSCASNSEMLRRQEVAYRNLGEVYMRQGNYTAALRELLKAEKAFSEDHILHDDLGQTYLKIHQKQPDLAIVHFKKALELKPDYSPARNNLGTAYMAKKDWDAAIACFKTVQTDLLYATPQFPLFNLGMAYYHKGEFETAEKYHREALALDPKYTFALRGLGLTYLAMDRIAEAVKVLEKAVDYAPEVPDFHFDLARAYQRSYEYPKAQRAYQKVIELAPESKLAAEAHSALKRF